MSLPRVGTPLRHRTPRGEFDVIVAGSGIGGLMAASLLAREGGKRVLVLERHYRAGGYSHVFTRPGYEWDVGVHYVGAVGPGQMMDSLFRLATDGALEWARLPEVYDAIELGPRRFEFRAGRANFIDGLAAHFPQKRLALEQYTRLVTQVSRKAQLELMKGVAPARGARLGAHRLKPSIPDWARETTGETLTRLGFDEVQRAVLVGQYGDYGAAPALSSFAIHAAVADHYLEGAYYPVGGSTRFATTLVPAIERAGGEVVTSAEVAEVLVEDARAVGVRLSSGETFRAPTVISDMGVANTFSRLAPGHRPAELVDAMAARKPSSSYLCLYVGLRNTDAELGLTGTNLWLYPDEHHDLNVQRYEDDVEAPLPLLYVSFPSAKDPDFQRRYPGRATVEVITMARWEWFERWAGTRWQKRGGEYEAFKARLQQRMLDALLARLPQLRASLGHVELSTPLSTAHFSGHPRGELYGLDGTPDRYRVQLRVRTSLEGLFLTGADVATAGVAGAAFAGAMAASSVLGGAHHLEKWFAGADPFARTLSPSS